MDVIDQLISVHYDGEGQRIQSHQMKASYVSISLKGLEVIYSEAFREANRVYKSQLSTEVVVEGGFHEGSLEWLLKIFISDSSTQQPLLEGPIASLVMKAINSVISLLKEMDLSVTEIVIQESSGIYEINIDGKRVVLDELQHAILTNPKIRKAISDIATPLTENGIDTLTINQGNSSTPEFIINKRDSDNLIIPRNHKYILETGSFSGFYYIDTLSYNPNSKWKIIDKDDPKKNIKVSIVDLQFLKRVSDNKEKFSKDDLLSLEGSWYKEKTSFTGKESLIYTVNKVKKHIPAEDKQWGLI